MLAMAEPEAQREFRMGWSLWGGEPTKLWPSAAIVHGDPSGGHKRHLLLCKTPQCG